MDPRGSVIHKLLHLTFVLIKRHSWLFLYFCLPPTLIRGLFGPSIWTRGPGPPGGGRVGGSQISDILLPKPQDPNLKKEGVVGGGGG